MKREISQILKEFVEIPSVNPGDCKLEDNKYFGEAAFVEHVYEMCCDIIVRNKKCCQEDRIC